MKTIAIYNECLTYEQLLAYTSTKSNKAEYAQIYMHISNCELCTCAVNGFAAMPFTSADVDAIHDQIDVKTNAIHANLLTFAHILIVVISLVSIFGFYKFADSVAEKKLKTDSQENLRSYAISISKNETLSSDENKIMFIDKPSKQAKIPVCKQLKISLPNVEPIKNISAEVLNNSLNQENVTLKPIYNSNVIYIYDLKVADYTNLYFNHAYKQFYFDKNVPPFKENEKSNNIIENETEQSIAADRVLKKGLEYFNKNRYSDAISEFQLLLENNPDDINALFYSGVAFYQMGKCDQAINNLKAVLLNINNTFHPEARWNLALTYMKSGDKIEARQLFTEIINEKGFYAKRAMDKLKAL